MARFLEKLHFSKVVGCRPNARHDETNPSIRVFNPKNRGSSLRDAGAIAELGFVDDFDAE